MQILATDFADSIWMQQKANYDRNRLHILESAVDDFVQKHIHMELKFQHFWFEVEMK